jgi:hypothetical protein
MREPDAYITGELDPSEMEKQRQMDLIGELLKRGDFVAIEAMGVKIMTVEEWIAAKADEPPDVIEIKNLN